MMTTPLYEQAEKALVKTKIALMQNNDSTFFTTVLFNLVTEISDEVPTAATNGKYIKVNPGFFMSLNPQERVFLLVHEAMHVAYMHMLRVGKRNKPIFNMAADYVINLELVNRNMSMPSGGLIDHAYKGMNTEQVYDLLLKNNKQPPSSMMLDIVPNSDGEDDESSDADLTKEIENILVRAHTQTQMSGAKPGSIPQELELFINSLLVPKLPWHRILAKYLTNSVKDDYSYRLPNRRHYPQYYLPSLYSESLAEVSVYVDISGSVSDMEFTQFVTEVSSIFKQLKPKKVRLIQFDTQIHLIDTLNNIKDLSKVVFKGRGGTDIAPVFEHIKATKPTISLIFTDGEFTKVKNYPKSNLIWLIHNNKDFKSDYGKVIQYEIKKA